MSHLDCRQGYTPNNNDLSDIEMSHALEAGFKAFTIRAEIKIKQVLHQMRKVYISSQRQDDRNKVCITSTGQPKYIKASHSILQPAVGYKCMVTVHSTAYYHYFHLISSLIFCLIFQPRKNKNSHLYGEVCARRYTIYGRSLRFQCFEAVGV